MFETLRWGVFFDRGHGILAHASSDRPRAPADEHATADSPWPNCEEARETPTHSLSLSQWLSLSWLACVSQYTACACSGVVRDMGATSRVRREGEGGRGKGAGDQPERQLLQTIARPAQSVRLGLQATALNAIGQSRVTLSLRKENLRAACEPRQEEQGA